MNSKFTPSNWIVVPTAERVRTLQFLDGWDRKRHPHRAAKHQLIQTVNDHRTDGLVAISEVPDARVQRLREHGISASRVANADARPT